MKRKIALLSFFIIFTMACQTVTQLFVPTTEIAPVTQISVAGDATATPRPSATVDPNAPPTPTLYYPTPETVTTNLTKQDQFDVFNELWQIVDESYLYEDFNGLDWDAVYDEYSSLIESGLNDQEFYFRMYEAVYRLGDDHSSFLDPDDVAEEDEVTQGAFDYVGVGIYILPILEEGYLTILLTFPGGPAERGGLQAHDNILAVDGVPVLDDEGDFIDTILGEEGTPVTLTILTPGQEPRDVTLIRARINATLPVPYQIMNTPSGKRIGYILIPSFYEAGIADRVGEALEALGQLDGLILDNRINGGGFDTMLRQTSSYFIDGTAGYFVNREEQRPFRVEGVDIHNSQSVPLVVLVDKGTVSFGEVFAGIMQDQERAYIIGVTTDGNIETLWGYDLSDGSRAWIAHDTFRPAMNFDSDWETSGIVPDLEIPAPWHFYTAEDDPAINAALDYFE